MIYGEWLAGCEDYVVLVALRLEILIEVHAYERVWFQPGRGENTDSALAWLSTDCNDNGFR